MLAVDEHTRPLREDVSQRVRDELVDPCTLDKWEKVARPVHVLERTLLSVWSSVLLPVCATCCGSRAS